MADGITIKVDGISELQAKFKNLNNELQTALSQAVSAGAAVVERSAKEKVRVDTGRLRNSIREMQKFESSGKVESQVGTDVEYGPANEFGTPRMQAQPYLRPAVDENTAEIEAAIEAKIKAILARYS